MKHSLNYRTVIIAELIPVASIGASFGCKPRHGILNYVNPLQQQSDVLAKVYDAALLDLDGVIYIGDDAVPAVIPVLNDMHSTHGIALTCITNNAARSAHTVATHLQRLGLKVTENDVVTSAQAAATELARLLPQGSPVFILGSPDLAKEIELVGLAPSQDPDQQYSAIVQGYWPEMPWRMLGLASKVINSGAIWIGTNSDWTIPTSFGTSPGNGTMIQALKIATGKEPKLIAGKPESPLMYSAIARTDSKKPLMIGDRLDTDILAANRIGIDSLLVFSGVTDFAELFNATPELRPTYLAWDASGIEQSHSAVEVDHGLVSLHNWRVAGDGLSGQGDALDAIRALAVAVWELVISPAQALQALAERGISLPKGEG
ncbi:MAG: HAD hydrolase-like protein [Actinomycetales bacterium]|nr:HAD hydrolase-like protein [Actinomycetales bacterium]